MAPKKAPSKAVIIRANQSGCWFGYVGRKTATEVELTHAIRMWYWVGASLSQVAAEGVGAGSKLGMPVSVTLRRDDVIEIIDCTAGAVKQIREVAPWRR